MKTEHCSLGSYSHRPELEKQAKRLVGDGKTNIFFISVSNQVLRPDKESGDTEYEPLYGDQYKSAMFARAFDKDEAIAIADEVELCAKYAVCSVIVESKDGQIYERTLQEKLVPATVTYEQVIL